MAKNQQRILDLHSTYSKLLDSLCFELCINKIDNNCLSLLQILLWRKKGQIDDTEFVELYRSWLQSKSVFDLFTCKQLEIYPKHELISKQIVHENFVKSHQINKALQKLNDTYNKLYKQKKPNSVHQLEQAQRIFCQLDQSGYIHLGLSSIFFLTASTIILEKFTIPLNYESFRIHMNDLRKEMCEIQGVVSLRCFKNYMLNLNSIKRSNYLDNLMNIFTQIQMAIGEEKNGLPNLLDEVCYKWRSFPRFNSGDNKKKLDTYKRIFEENQRIFFDECANTEYFLQKYGEEFVIWCQIDNSLLKQFTSLLKQSLNRYIEIFTKVSQKVNSKNNEKNEKQNNLVMTHRKKPTGQLPQAKPMQKVASMREKTPTKSQKTIQYRNRTPTKSFNQQSEIKKQFGSAEKVKSKTNAFRQVTPTKSYRLSQGLQQSQANTTQKNAIKLGVDKDSFYNKLLFFRNKRVESYQIVMKRLKNK